jgi:hypothetical protein
MEKVGSFVVGNVLRCALPERGVCLGQIPRLGLTPFKGLHMCKELSRNQMKCKMSFFQLENKFGIT